MNRIAALAMLTLVCAGCAAARPAVSTVRDALAAEASALYPPLEPYAKGWLRVSPQHELYYEESGNPRGKPVVFLHGGPGSGTRPAQRRFFDPAAYRIILFDQAGTGLSRSTDPLAANTLPELVRHLERLRAHLDVERWMLFGGSWGATLALAYAEAHPERVSELVAWGVFLSRPRELDWVFKEGFASALHPEAFERFRDFVPPAERRDLVRAYLRRFRSADALVRREAVRRWTDYEDVLGSHEPEPPPQLAPAELDDRYLRRALIEASYFTRGSDLSATRNELLENVGKLAAIPVVLVAGRYDLVCPIQTAFEVKRRLPSAELFVEPHSGHLSGAHPEVLAELVRATDRFRPAR